MDPVKVVGVREWPTPENKTDVQAFLGFVNFYRRFIRDFSAKARPLFDLTHSKQVWTWSGRKQMAFEDLKMVVTTAPVLMSPQDLEPFRVEADSSDFTTAVLSQQSMADGKWHPVDGDQREFDLETRVTTNGNNKTPRCFIVVH